MSAAHNVEALVAHRQALVAWLESLPEDGWTDEVRGEVSRLVDLYADALTGTLGPDQQATLHGPDGDPAGLVAELVRYAGQYEQEFAEDADERWDDMTREEFREVGGTTGMGMSGVLLGLHRAAHLLGRITGRPVEVPAESQAAAVAALSWLAGDKVEAPVQVVIEGGRDFVVGSGPVAGTLRTDHEALIGVATGEATPEQLAAEGRWVFEGPQAAEAAFERSLSTTFDD